MRSAAINHDTDSFCRDASTTCRLGNTTGTSAGSLPNSSNSIRYSLVGDVYREDCVDERQRYSLQAPTLPLWVRQPALHAASLVKLKVVV